MARLGDGKHGLLRRRRSAPSPPDLHLAAHAGDADAEGSPHTLAPLRRPAGPAISVRAACEQFVESVRVRRPETRTASNYEKVLSYLVTWLETRTAGKGADVWAVSADDLEAWVRELQTTPAQNKRGEVPRSVYTVANYARHASACWRALADRGLVPEHVATSFRVPAIPRSKRVKPRTYTDSDVAALFAACSEGELGTERDALTVRNQAILAVLLDSGCRVGELVSMRVDLLDWERRAVPVLKSKTEVRTISFGGEQTAQRLRRYVQRARSYLATVEMEDEQTGNAVEMPRDDDITPERGPLWLNRDGWPLAAIGVAELLDRLKRRSGGAVTGPCSPHVCRRYYITRAIQRGVPIVEIARQCGVSPDVIMRHYYSATEDESLAKVRQGSPLDALEDERRRALGRAGPQGGRAGRSRRGGMGSAWEDEGES